MFEIIILCIIGLAVGYWLTLFLSGRRQDVLHGDFVEAEPSQETQLPLAPLPAASADRLQSLLTAIKQDLRDAAQI